jgi:hypothetical protein
VPRALKDENAVSTVLGAILMVGLLVITLVRVQTVFVPVWDQQGETNLMAQVANQVAQINSDFQRQVGNLSSAPVSDPITLGEPSGFSFFQSPRLPGTVSFNPATGGAGLNLASPNLIEQNFNGQDLTRFNEQWKPVSATITQILKFDHLRLRMKDPASHTGTMTLALTDKNNAYAGKITLVNTATGGNGNNIEVSFFGPQSSTNPVTVTDVFFATGGGGCTTNCPYFYLDTLDPTYQFQGILGLAQLPLTATLSLSGTVTGDYSIIYDTPAPGGGTIRQGGTNGLPVPNYSSTAGGGVLSVRIPNNYYPTQTYTFEYGAVFLDQPEGSIMEVPPQFSASSNALQAAVTWTYPGLIGSIGNAAGTTQTTVSLVPSGPHSVLGIAHSLSLTISTTHPALWQSYWASQMQQAGIASDPALKGLTCLLLSWPPGYKITTTATSATLSIVGSCSLLNDTSPTVFVAHQESDTRITVQPAS